MSEKHLHRMHKVMRRVFVATSSGGAERVTGAPQRIKDALSEKPGDEAKINTRTMAYMLDACTCYGSPPIVVGVTLIPIAR